MGEGRGDFGRVHGRIPAYNADGTDPVKIGGLAWAGTPTPGTNLYLINTWHDLYGRIVVLLNGPPTVTADSTKGPKSVSVVSPTDTVVITSPGAGNSIRVSSIYASNLDPTTSINLSIKEGATTRTLGQVHTQGGGFVWSYEPGGWILGNNLALLAALNATYLGTGVQVNVQYQVIATPT